MKKLPIKLTKKTYQTGFMVVVLILACIRWAFPSIAEGVRTLSDFKDDTVTSYAGMPHRIRSVASYQTCFPDTNAVQLVAAQRWGVSPVRNREDAESRKRELVYVGSNPYYHVDKLYSSIPYLVPHAAALLQDIGEAFYDSLYVKGLPLHRIIVTSVLRSQEDSCADATGMPRRTPATCTVLPSIFATTAMRRWKILKDRHVVRYVTTPSSGYSQRYSVICANRVGRILNTK